CQAIALAGSRLFVGGTYSQIDGVPVNHIGEYDFDTDTWSSPGSGTSGTVRAIALRGNDVFVGGDFVTAGGVPALRIARYDRITQAWASLDGAGGGADLTVNAIAFAPGEVLLGGDFSSVGGTAANRIARYVEATSTWSTLGSGEANGVTNGSVRAIAAAGGEVYVGGTFLLAGGTSANRIARFDRASATWAPLGAGGANGVSSFVAALVHDGRFVYAGGDFLSVHGQAINGVARWNANTQAWSSLASGLQSGSGVTHLALDGSALHVSGSFVTAGGRTANQIATWDTRAPVTTTLSSTATSFPPRTSITLTATVTVDAFPPTPGTVAFLDGSVAIAGCDAIALAGAGSTRTAQCTTDAFAAGSHRLYAQYAGDSDHAADTSAALEVATLVPAVAVSPATVPDARLGTPYAATLTASGDSGALAPFALDVVEGAFPPGLALDAGTGVLSGTPGGTRTTTAFVIGAHDASTADVGGPFAGRRNYSLVVLGLATSTSLASSANPQRVNSPLTLTATITGPDPAGSVAFRDGGIALPGCDAVPLAGAGSTRTAQCTTSALPVGQRTLTAVYAGDSTHEPSTSAPLAQTIDPPVIVLAPATLAGAFVGVPYDQQVSASGDGALAPFGFDNGGFQGAPPLPPGLTLIGSSGQISGTPQQTGSYAFTVRAADASPASVGGPFIGQRDYAIEVQLQPTTTTIASIAPSPATQAEAYVVSVSVAGLAGTPGGTVAVSDGVGASCFVTLSAGGGSCQMASGTVGPRTITASYGGLPPHAPSVGSAMLQIDPSSSASASRISVGARVGVRGQTVAVPITFRGDGTTVQVTAQITFDKARLGFVSAQGIGGASCARLVAPNDDRISFRAPDTPTGQPLSPNLDTRYCELAFRIADTATGGVVPLGIVTSTCEDGGGIQRVCTTQNGAVSVSAVETSSPNLSLLAIAGYEAAVSASRSVRVTNRGDVPLTFDCTVFGPTDFALDAGASATVPPQLDQLVVVSCTLPPLGTTLSGQLVCTTSDAARPTLQYGLTCQRVPDGAPLPADQIFDDGLKQGDQLGTSTAVSQSGAGSILVVGAPFAGGDADGRVLIYESARAGVVQPASLREGKRARALDTLRRVAMLAPPRSAATAAGTAAKGGGSIGDKFGQAVAVSPSGDRVAIGAPLGGGAGAGQVLVYSRPPGGWDNANLSVPDVTIDAPFLAGSSVAEFGASVAFFADGDLAIGAPGTASGVGGVGAAFVYDAGTATSYSRTETLLSTAPQGQGRFGESVAVAVELGAGQLVVGAPQEGPLGQQTGNAYVYPVANGAIGLPQRIASSEPSPGDKWGASVAVRDGTIVVGAPGDDTGAGVDSGSATVFRPRPDESGVDPVTTLVPGPGTSQGAGAAVATNGDLIVIGAPLATVGGRIGQGRIYLYDIDVAFAPSEDPVQTLENNDGRAEDAFGRALAINSRNVLAGVPLDDRELDATTRIEDVGRADPFVLDRILRTGFE
ncbi:MAG TPA: Ig-like domain repeat protein, partial [Xanthomonadales bacterium]|nr:Ig-like domain repeat protein [Xanthomonadales bacterium]